MSQGCNDNIWQCQYFGRRGISLATIPEIILRVGQVFTSLQIRHPSKEVKTIRVPVKDSKSPRGLSMESFPILHPHRVLAYLFDVVGIDVPDHLVQQYWDHSRQVGEPWAVNSPASRHHVPIGLHGDAARLWTVYQFEKHVAIFMNLVLFRPTSTRYSRFLLFSIPHNKLFKNRTLNRVWERLAWSLEACYKGKNPDLGPRGIPLKGKNLERANLPITKGNRVFCVTEYRGDWEWHRDTFRPRASWNSLQVCFKCPATLHGDHGYIFHNPGSCPEDGCKWVQEEYSLEGFISKALKEKNLCGLVSQFTLNKFYDRCAKWYPVVVAGPNH